MARTRKMAKRGAAKRKTTGRKRWSRRVTAHNDALTLEQGVFTNPGAKAVVRSLKCSADKSRRRKSGAYRSAMSMLAFFINRVGKGLSTSRKTRLENAKDELHALCGKT